MATSKLVGLLFEAWKDMDRVLDGLDPHEAIEQFNGGSSYAWTTAHVANQLDAWINVRFQQLEPHELIGQERFRIGGTGAADDWDAIQASVREVREVAHSFLEAKGEEELNLVVPYDGSFTRLHQTGLSLRYALLRLCAHHYYHIGEIATKRDMQGQQVGDYPGELEQCI